MNPWAEKLRDAILSNSALREGIQDDDAQPFIDWGLSVADRVTQGLPSMPDNMAATRFETVSAALPKLMTRITWVVVHRQKKGPDWTSRTLAQLNELNQALYGANAPQLSEERITELANQQDDLPPGALITSLIESLSPQDGEL